MGDGEGRWRRRLSWSCNQMKQQQLFADSMVGCQPEGDVGRVNLKGGQTSVINGSYQTLPVQHHKS